MATEDKSFLKKLTSSAQNRAALYTSVLSVTCAFLLVIILEEIEADMAGPPSSSNVVHFLAGGSTSTLVGYTRPVLRAGVLKEAGPSMVQLVLIVIFSGALGGCLYNMRGIVNHTEAKRGCFKDCYEVSYYMAPLGSAISGLVVVILLLGGVFTFGSGEQRVSGLDISAGQMMTLVAVAAIAGYGSRQFKRKLNDLADTIFSSEPPNPEDSGEEKPTA